MNQRTVQLASEGTGAIIVTSKEKISFAEGCTLDVALDDQLVAGLESTR